MKRLISGAVLAAALVVAPIAAASPAAAFSSSSGPSVPAPPHIPDLPGIDLPDIPELPVTPPVDDNPIEPEVPAKPEVPVEPEQPVEPEPEQPADPVDPTPVDLDHQQQRLADAASAYREANGSPALQRNATFDAYAQEWAVELATTGQFEHDDLTTEPGVYGENLVILYTGEDVTGAVDRAWDQSPGHRANLLFRHHTDVGHGVATMQEGHFTGRTLVVQKLGR